MAYYLDLFSPEVYKGFTKSSSNISGFRMRQVDMGVLLGSFPLPWGCGKAPTSAGDVCAGIGGLTGGRSIHARRIQAR